jgi:hypothetical protein
MDVKGRRLLQAIGLLLSPVLPLALTLGTPTGADASGPEFHIVETLACSNPSFCGGLDLSGFHGSAQFNPDGTASGQLTALGLLHGRPGAGTDHFAIDIADLSGQPGWFVGPNGDFFITNETDTFTGTNGGPPVTVFDAFPPYPHDLGIPATPGHLNTTELFGFAPPPGVTFQIQVTQLPG